MDKKEQMIQLKKEGKTYQKIGEYFRVSRQRIHQILTGHKSPYHKSPHYKEYQRRKNRRYKEMVLRYYGGNPPRCAKCGFDNINCLEIDHINNKGAEHRKEISGSQRGSGASYYRWLINNDFPEGYQVLCKNCNWLKYLRYQGVMKDPRSKEV